MMYLKEYTRDAFCALLNAVFLPMLPTHCITYANSRHYIIVYYVGDEINLEVDSIYWLKKIHFYGLVFGEKLIRQSHSYTTVFH